MITASTRQNSGSGRRGRREVEEDQKRGKQINARGRGLGFIYIELGEGVAGKRPIHKYLHKPNQNKQHVQRLDSRQRSLRARICE